MKAHCSNLDIGIEQTSVILKGRKDREEVCFKMGTHEIRLKRSVKYLSVWLDDRLSYTKHVKRVIVKAKKSIRAIIRFLPNISGPRNEENGVLCGLSSVTYFPFGSVAIC